MIFCKELKKEFASKSEMFKALKDNQSLIIDQKKSTIKFSDWLDLKVSHTKSDAEKVEGENTEIKIGDFIYPVINTTNFLDSHGDVHMDGIWDVSVSDQKNKVYYIINHDLELGKVIAYPEDVEPMLKTMNWTDLGRDFQGTTQALIFKVKLSSDGNQEAVKAIMAKRKLENSIRMRYIRVKLCINEPSQYYKEEYSNWNYYIGNVANKDKAEEEGYFFAVLEAQIYKEGSAVLYGSNEVTPILTSINENEASPSDDSSGEKEKVNPSADSSAAIKRSIINQLM